MTYSYVIIDDNPENVSKTKAIADGFSELQYITSAHNYTDALDLILEHSPQLIFLEIDPQDKKSKLSFHLIDALYRYLDSIPQIIITTTTKEFAFEAIQYEVMDYLIKPIKPLDLKKTILKLNKHKPSPTPLYPSQNQAIEQLWQDKTSNDFLENELRLCIKSYGDHRFIDTKDICFIQADNNSTDLHLSNGEVITAFKTLKHFESLLSTPFIRIHNSYIINRNYISRIHTGNSLVYIKNTSHKLPFSKSYKKNIDDILVDLSNDNYLEI